MKDYFASLKFIPVTNGNAGNNAQDIDCMVTNQQPRADSVGNKSQDVPTIDIAATSMPLLNGNATNTAISPVTSITTCYQFKYQESEKCKYWELYQERAGILEYDCNMAKHEAERLAYQAALKVLVSDICPEIIALFDSIIHQARLN